MLKCHQSHPLNIFIEKSGGSSRGRQNSSLPTYCHKTHYWKWQMMRELLYCEMHSLKQILMKVKAISSPSELKCNLTTAFETSKAMPWTFQVLLAIETHFTDFMQVRTFSSNLTILRTTCISKLDRIKVTQSVLALLDNCTNTLPPTAKKPHCF